MFVICNLTLCVCDVLQCECTCGLAGHRCKDSTARAIYIYVAQRKISRACSVDDG